MFLKNKIKDTRLFNKIKEQEIYWRLKEKFFNDVPAHIYLTLKCNLSCPYCVNQANPKESKIGKYNFSPGEKWIKAINNMNKTIVFTGGEPTLHPDFIKIVNGIKKELSIIVYTNFCWSEQFTEDLLSQLKRPIKVLGSYHPSCGRPEKILEVIKKLRKKGLFDGMIHAVGTKSQKGFLEKQVRPVFKRDGFFLTIDKDQFEFFNKEACCMKFRKTVHCSGKGIIIAPDGKRYQCVSKMLRMKDPLEDVFTENLRKDEIHSICPDYGFCSPCDMGFKRIPISSQIF